MNLNKFKKGAFISLAAAGLISVIACSKDESEIVTESSKIEIKDFAVAIAEGDTTLLFQPANNWTASLSTTSWIEIDPMTKVGTKNDQKIILKWKGNNGVTSRNADLTIAVNGETPVRIRITQTPSAPTLEIDTEESVLAISTQDKVRGQFLDTLTVTSNLGWTLKSKPSWIEHRFVGNKEPQQGVPTTIQLVLEGLHDRFNSSEMVGQIVIGMDSDTENDRTIDVKAISELNLISTDNADYTVEELNLVFSPEAGNVYIASFIAESNSAWAISDFPEWAEATPADNDYFYSSSLNTRVQVNITMKPEDLDTEKMEAVFSIGNKNIAGLSKNLKLVFPGTGDSFYQTFINLGQDYVFPAENASHLFKMYSAKQFSNMNDAPCRFYFLTSYFGFPTTIPAYWATVEMTEVQTKAALNEYNLGIILNNRHSWEEDAYKERQAIMFTVPSDVEFEDLFDEVNGGVKEEYMENITYISQRGLTMPEPVVNIPDYVEFSADASKQSFSMENVYGASLMIRDFTVEEEDRWDSWRELNNSDWIITDYESDDYGICMGITIETEENTSGNSRQYLVRLTNFNPVTEESDIIKEFTITQRAN